MRIRILGVCSGDRVTGYLVGGSAATAGRARWRGRPRRGRGQAPPRYEMTAQDRQAIQAKLDELDPLVRALKAKRGEDDLMADVEIHAKAGHWVLEFPMDVTVQDDVTFALKMLDRGIERAKQLQNGQSPWTSQKGKVALGFYSPLDGSVQPLLLTIPAGYDGKPTRLDIVLHGRSQRLIESNWICYDPSPANAATYERLSQHTAGSCLQPTPNPPANGVWNAGQFQLEVFARGNNANHWAGEVDVFESTAAVQRRFKIDDSRLVLRGFSLGGAGAWHLALHHPDRWVAAEIGAGTWPRRYLMMNDFPAHQRPTLRIWENMTEWALNAFNIPIAGHDGDSDPQVASIPRPPEGEPTRGQLESSIRIREQLAKEGYPYEGEPTSYVAKGTPSIFLISENTGHSTSPKVRQRLDAFLKEWTDRGLQSPDHVRFLTYTTRYNKSFWVTIDGLGQHYERAEVDAQRLSGGTSYQIKTTNVSRLVLRETDKATEIQIDGQTLRVKPGRELALEKTAVWLEVGAGEVGRPAQDARPAGSHRRCVSRSVPAGAPDRHAVESGRASACAEAARALRSNLRALLSRAPAREERHRRHRSRLREIQRRAVRRSRQQSVDRPPCGQAAGQVEPRHGYGRRQVVPGREPPAGARVSRIPWRRRGTSC